MPEKHAYQAEIDELIEKYITRLENDEKRSNKLMTAKETLALLHADGDYPYKKRMDSDEYEATLEALQLELVKAQYWIQRTGQKVAVVFEGRDAAGKGGTIQRFLMNLNPRHINHIALAKPTKEEQTQWYFQRYIPHLPSAGEISFFDRSWYNRAGVERVMGFCTDVEYERFMAAVSNIERHWVSAGIILIKYWLSVNQLEQLRRFRRRQTSELRRWKLSPNDIESVDKWDDYSVAIEALFKRTSHRDSPWHEIKTDDKMRGRITCIKHFLSQLNYPDKNTELVTDIDTRIITTHEPIN